ncbi:MAG: YciK family oxidoreductase [Gammaproteobacteria bacterium]|nr:YciK family oxidoreductase [Gammaproteobacteria bacterium]
MNDYQAPPHSLKDRVILVTGAGDGLGRAVARAAAAQGASLILLGRTTAKLEQVYDQIESDGSPQPAIFPLNLETAAANTYADLADVIAEEFGALHGLVHCAAQLRLLSRIDDYDLETWNQLLQVNLTAPFLLTQACLPLLKTADRSSLIFTSDSLGRRAKAYWGAYAVAKFGLEGLMQVLADELESSPVRVNSIDPGPLRTNLRKTAYPAEDELQHPPPESVTPAYLHLLGADGANIHGQAISLSPQCLWSDQRHPGT